MTCHAVEADGARCQKPAEGEPADVWGRKYPVCMKHRVNPSGCYVAPAAPSRKSPYKIDPSLPRPWREEALRRQ